MDGCRTEAWVEAALGHWPSSKATISRYGGEKNRGRTEARTLQPCGNWQQWADTAREYSCRQHRGTDPEQIRQGNTVVGGISPPWRLFRNGGNPDNNGGNRECNEEGPPLRKQAMEQAQIRKVGPPGPARAVDELYRRCIARVAAAGVSTGPYSLVYSYAVTPLCP